MLVKQLDPMLDHIKLGWIQHCFAITLWSNTLHQRFRPAQGSVAAVALLGETVARLVPLGSLELLGEGSLDLTNQNGKWSKRNWGEVSIQNSDFNQNYRMIRIQPAQIRTSPAKIEALPWSTKTVDSTNSHCNCSTVRLDLVNNHQQ